MEEKRNAIGYWWEIRGKEIYRKAKTEVGE
jgi:hypothetical protein